MTTLDSPPVTSVSSPPRSRARRSRQPPRRPRHPAVPERRDRDFAPRLVAAIEQSGLTGRAVAGSRRARR